MEVLRRWPAKLVRQSEIKNFPNGSCRYWQGLTLRNSIYRKKMTGLGRTNPRDGTLLWSFICAMALHALVLYWIGALQQTIASRPTGNINVVKLNLVPIVSIDDPSYPPTIFDLPGVGLRFGDLNVAGNSVQLEPVGLVGRSAAEQPGQTMSSTGNASPDAIQQHAPDTKIPLIPCAPSEATVGQDADASVLGDSCLKG